MAQREPAAPMKVSFSIPKSSFSQRRPPLPPKAQSSSADAVEYVTSVDAEAGVVLANPRAARGARVVPKQENSWRPEERMKNIRMEADATRSTEETFEMETMGAGPKPNVVYGLTVMKTRGDEDGAEGPRQTISLKELEDQKLREDMLNLPEEATLETYDELPVEEFGEALLRGMGWEKGKPVGRNAKAVVEPIEFEKRQGTLGLGAVPAPPKEINKKYIKPGESRPKQRPDLGAAAIGRTRNTGEPDTKLVRRGVVKEKIMSIIAGPYCGRSGEVVSIDDEGGKSSQVLVKLIKSGERVVVYDDELADVGSWEEESAMKKMGELSTANGKAEKSQDRHRTRTEESRGKTLSEKHREDERHSKRSHRHREEEDERYSKRGHGHHEEEDDRYAKRGHRYSEGEDERYAKRGHRRSDGDRRGERRGHKDRSERR